MTKISSSIIKGAQEALTYAKGHKKNMRIHKVMIPKTINVQKIRDHLQMTRQEFSENFGFSIRTLEKWERFERQPDTSTRAYLIVIDKNPRAVRKALLAQ